MTPLGRRTQATTANEDRPGRAARAAAREARIRRVFDGVVASYIHEISVRAGASRLPQAQAAD